MIAVLPKGSKPTKGASSDETRPILCRGELVDLGADSWVLVVTDSYKLVRIPLTLQKWDGTPELIAGPVSADALKAIEKSGAFTASVDTVEPWQRQRQGFPPMPADGAPAFARAGGDCDGQFPNVEQLMPDGEVIYRFGFNAALLLELVQSVGTLGKSGKGAVVVFEYRARNFNDQVNLRGTTVSVGEHRDVGLIMPVRVDRPDVADSVLQDAVAAAYRDDDAVADEAPAAAPLPTVAEAATEAAAARIGSSSAPAPVDVDRAALADVNAVLDAAVGR